LDEDEGLIDAEPAGKMLGHSRRYMWDHAKEFPFAYHIGNRWKFSPSGIRRWLKRRRAAGLRTIVRMSKHDHGGAHDRA
jgi:predicted DNA-binding transcriptional regulator AlpA